MDDAQFAGYHQFTNDSGSFEVFRDHPDFEPGWYWWACFPGYIPEGDATGPFPTVLAGLSAFKETIMRSCRGTP